MLLSLRLILSYFLNQVSELRERLVLKLKLTLSIALFYRVGPMLL